MQALCHRCQAELPGAATGAHRNSEDLVLFCPHCGAPQLLLAEHMRMEDPAGQATTGTLPPPRVGRTDRREVDWRRALQGAGAVALAGAVLVLVGLKINAVAFLALCWLLSGSAISVGLYARQRPRVWVDGRAGLRVGVVTGLLMVGAVGLAGTGTGLVMRFVTHGLGAFDAQNVEQTKLGQAWGVRWLQERNEDKEVQETYLRFVNSPLMTSPEVRAGTELAQFGFQAFLLVMFSAGGGALAGVVQGRRGAAMRAE